MNEIFDPHDILIKLRNIHKEKDNSNFNSNINSNSNIPFPPHPLNPPPPLPSSTSNSSTSLNYLNNQQDNKQINLINEMEIEINKLTSEVIKLKNINKQIQYEKKYLENQLNEQKEKSDDVIAKLRSNFFYFLLFLFIYYI